MVANLGFWMFVACAFRGEPTPEPVARVLDAEDLPGIRIQPTEPMPRLRFTLEELAGLEGHRGLTECPERLAPSDLVLGLGARFAYPKAISQEGSLVYAVSLESSGSEGCVYAMKALLIPPG